MQMTFEQLKWIENFEFLLPFEYVLHMNAVWHILLLMYHIRDISKMIEYSPKK